MKKVYTVSDIADFSMRFYDKDDSLDTLKGIIVQAIEWADMKLTEDLFGQVFDEILYRLA